MPRMTPPDDDPTRNPSAAATFDAVVAERLSRRDVLAGGLASMFLGGWLSACARRPTADPQRPPSPEPARTAPTAPRLGFAAVPKGRADAVVVPRGYRVTVVCRTGDPLTTAVGAYANDGTDDAESFTTRAGDHADGMHFFGLGADGRHDATVSAAGLLACNHESITPNYLHVNGPTYTGRPPAAIRTVASEVVKEILCHGVSILTVRRGDAGFYVDAASTFNRRVTPETPTEVRGPAAGSMYLVTRYSPDGTKCRGTLNNCANGQTPWGTYLTCEENWSNYFRRGAADDARRTERERTAFARYGVGPTDRVAWSSVEGVDPEGRFARWNVEHTGKSIDGSDDFRNEANTFGWIVEIDPFAPTSAPRKRTALGRFAHEACTPAPAVPGEPLVWYMGCDARNEYIYKFVSKKVWDPADANGGLDAGDRYMDEGTLYVARFDADGTGTWLELSFGLNGITVDNTTYSFTDQADVVVHARLAADAAGATPMDRPEWCAVNPVNGDVYVTLTNTNAKARPIDKVDAANPRHYADGVGNAGNPNGHIVRFAEAGGDHAASRFTWDIYLFGARATAEEDVNLSGLTHENDLSSPDGCRFSRANPGLLWIQTDDTAMLDTTNCMLLAALPGQVGDGGTRTVRNRRDGASSEVVTPVGAAPGAEGLRRFLVGPNESEITGIAETPDGRTLFVNIQHPGEDTIPNFADPTSFGSHWPDGGAARPRSATIAIERVDGGPVGLT